MPYEWISPPQSTPQKMRLWPHNSLPARGMAAFVLTTFTLISIPVLPLLGSPILWGLLPFTLAAVWGMYWALQRNYKSRQISEELVLDETLARLTRINPKGDVQEWDCDRYWTKVTKYEDEGPVPNYVTLRGKGREVEIGAFLSEEERIALFEDLERVLRR
ncbi:DUF2244 domain-containing protein [Sulfitobacter guttiformis]|uniref:Putative membrane protein n=1 Tax=Sulfitobacter guttiformis TaxID=74349 RepID=A0A420DJI3_9RHOB|nr:DUF2244 domain-containing protein [Sulfitobacter guttiformis]RKE94400.1 putative membrane protein [Sulfitobacter guttiformis]